MPKELTHWLLADRACAGLDRGSRVRGIIETHRATYLGGAVLPDTLLHLFRGTHAASALALAHSFHDTADNSFAPLIRAEGCCPDGIPPALLACLLGVITHIETDIVFHPFVYALTGPAGIGRHYRIETDIDCFFLHSGTIPEHRHLADLMSPEVQNTLSSASALLFDPDGRLPRHTHEQALALHCRFQSMYDSSFWKLLVRLLAAVIGPPFREQLHLFYPLSSSDASCIEDTIQHWQHPVSGELHHTTLDELANRVVCRIIRVFSLIEEKGSLTAALLENPGENLLTGLQGVCRSTICGSTPGS